VPGKRARSAALREQPGMLLQLHQLPRLRRLAADPEYRAARAHGENPAAGLLQGEELRFAEWRANNPPASPLEAVRDYLALTCELFPRLAAGDAAWRSLPPALEEALGARGAACVAMALLRKLVEWADRARWRREALAALVALKLRADPALFALGLARINAAFKALRGGHDGASARDAAERAHAGLWIFGELTSLLDSDHPRWVIHRVKLALRREARARRENEGQFPPELRGGGARSAGPRNNISPFPKKSRRKPPKGGPKNPKAGGK
jgi:hypothetical protein